MRPPHGLAEKVLNSGKPVSAASSAEWFGLCSLVAPLFETFADEHSGKITIVLLTVDESP